MQPLLDTAPKAAPKKAAPKKTTVKKSLYDRLVANGWGGLLKTYDAGTIKKLKA